MEISLPVTAAVLGAALLHAGWNALLKSSAAKQLDTVALSVGSALIALAVAVMTAPTEIATVSRSLSREPLSSAFQPACNTAAPSTAAVTGSEIST